MTGIKEARKEKKVKNIRLRKGFFFLNTIKIIAPTASANRVKSIQKKYKSLI
jgi:hypothetical protein